MSTLSIKRRRSKVKLNYSQHVLVVFRSNENIIAQVLEPITKRTLFTVNSNKLKNISKTEKSRKVGQEIADKLIKNKISKVVFDRNGLLYHGRVKSLVDVVLENKIEI